MRKTKWAVAPCFVVFFWGAGGIASAGTVTVGDGESFSYVYNGEKTDAAPGGSIMTEESGHVSNVAGGTVGTAVYGGYSGSFNVAENVVNVESGAVGGLVVGGYVKNSAGRVEKNTVNITGDVFGNEYSVYGGQNESASVNAGAVTGNRVNLTGVALDGLGVVCGGYRTTNGLVSGNVVRLTDSSFTGTIYGGRGYNNGAAVGEASGNTVVLTNSVVTGSVYGGRGNVTTGNTVSLQSGAVAGTGISGKIYGGNQSGNTTGNTLLLGNYVQDDGTVKYADAANRIVNKVSREVLNFETIRLDPSLRWNPGATALSADYFTNCGALNVSEATGLFSAETPGIMTLISSNRADDFSALSLIAPDGTTALNGAAPSATVYRETKVSEKYGVTVDYDMTHTVSLNADGYKKVVYAVEAGPVKQISLGEMEWGTGRDIVSEGLVCDADTKIDADKLTFARPETIAANSSMTLAAANQELTDMAARTKNISYAVSPVPGLTVDAELRGSYAASGGVVSYTAVANAASKLTFGDVEWKDTGELLDHAATLTNVSFDGADVDTTNINFTNLQGLEAGRKMTLVSSFGDTVGTITGTKYKVGSTLEGEGRASLAGKDLIFTAETGTGSGGESGGLKVQEQTHNAVMGAAAGMAALSAGNDFIGAAAEGLSLAANVGADGVSSFARMGGGSMRQETGSHVDTHTWNAILALGHKNEKEKSSFEYGAFFEYGTGNYTTHNGDERGDGSMRYTGGGVLAKWTARHGFYVEGSLRAGTVHDDARNVLRDAGGVPYSYETDAPYFGGHVGVGREIALSDGSALDVYGKYFCNRRNGVDFEAGGRYDLDAVTSSVIRAGARYILKRSKWNFYAGAAYEHELDGKAEGTADGLAIRGADLRGGSFRGELGAEMQPDRRLPLTLHFDLTAFAGKKQGLSGGVSVALTF